ncbi:hypothetical protein [Mycobacterium sp. 852013-50091_SCH5140682]|uniref:hypothetical protein n=1 Tax=Mycobacterium sp. 852013-50091_SCH5140682 TaxID=1834109 RepID=UPI0012EAF5B9|nr:hypothetical protein [Mycobacterium sp. 852013-50091_SCH5140682]
MKWALGGVTLIAVIAITAAVSIALTKGSGGGGNGTPTASASPSATASGTASNSDFASANDTGPVNIIKDEPTCAAWTPINNTLAGIEQKSWAKRDTSVPASDWTPELRQAYQEVGQAMQNAAKQTAELAKKTPHRVMRELYQQFIAYGSAYADTLDNYVPENNNLVIVVGAVSSAISGVCGSIDYGSAASRTLSLPVPDPPNVEIVATGNSERFIKSPDSSCGDWSKLIEDFKSATTGWHDVDSALPASSWNAEQKAAVEAAIPVMQDSAKAIEDLGRRSKNSTVQDFAVLAAQYRRAYADALPTYVPADSYLFSTSANAAFTISAACKAAGG